MRSGWRALGPPPRRADYDDAADQAFFAAACCSSQTFFTSGRFSFTLRTAWSSSSRYASVAQQVGVGHDDRRLVHRLLRVGQLEGPVVLHPLRIPVRNRAGAVVEVQQRRRSTPASTCRHIRTPRPPSASGRPCFGRPPAFLRVVDERHGVVGLARDARIAPGRAQRPAQLLQARRGGTSRASPHAAGSAPSSRVRPPRSSTACISVMR